LTTAGKTIAVIRARRKKGDGSEPW